MASLSSAFLFELSFKVYEYAFRDPEIFEARIGDTRCRPDAVRGIHLYYRSRNNQHENAFREAWEWCKTCLQISILITPQRTSRLRYVSVCAQKSLSSTLPQSYAIPGQKKAQSHSHFKKALKIMEGIGQHQLEVGFPSLGF